VADQQRRRRHRKLQNGSFFYFLVFSLLLLSLCSFLGTKSSNPKLKALDLQNRKKNKKGLPSFMVNGRVYVWCSCVRALCCGVRVLCCVGRSWLCAWCVRVCYRCCVLVWFVAVWRVCVRQYVGSWWLCVCADGSVGCCVAVFGCVRCDFCVSASCVLYGDCLCYSPPSYVGCWILFIGLGFVKKSLKIMLLGLRWIETGCVCLFWIRTRFGPILGHFGWLQK